MPYVVIVGGPKINTIHRVLEKGCKIGRGLAASWHLSIEKDMYISRRGQPPEGGALTVGEVGHAEIFRHDGKWYLRDLKSQDGVLIAGKGRCSRLVEGGDVALAAATLFECGQSMFVFMDIDTEPSKEFARAASGQAGAVQSSAMLSHTGLSKPASTQSIGPVQAEVPVLLARWETVKTALRGHGYSTLVD
jgi:hypothetical protein